MARFIYDERVDAFVTPEEYYRDDTPYEDEEAFVFIGCFAEEEDDEWREMFGWDYSERRKVK